jgi:hypothetical protein
MKGFIELRKAGSNDLIAIEIHSISSVTTNFQNGSTIVTLKELNDEGINVSFTVIKSYDDVVNMIRAATE